MSDENHIIVNIRLGALAGILTASEYILGSLAAIAGAALVRGIWLEYLHRGGVVPMSVKSRAARHTLRDFISFFIGICFVTAIALVETTLEPTYLITQQTVPESRCLQMAQWFHPLIQDSLIPPLQVNVEPWITRVAQILDCPLGHGIETVGLKSFVDIEGKEINISAPVCADEKLYPKNLSIALQYLSVESDGFEFNVDEAASAEIIPYWLKPIQRSVQTRDQGLIPDPDGANECLSRSISPDWYEMNTEWTTTMLSGHGLSRTLYYEMCRLHGDRLIATLPLDVEKSCEQNFDVSGEPFDNDDHHLNPACLLEKTELYPNVAHSVKLSNVSVIIVNKKSQSFVCVDADISVDYVFVSMDILRYLKYESQFQTPALVMAKISVISGHCERTVHVIGRAALLYSAEAEWRDTYMAQLNRVERYHAFVIAVSTSIFPLDQLQNSVYPYEQNPADAAENDKLLKKECMVRPVTRATKIPKGGAFIFLITVTAVSSFVIILAFLIRVLVFCRGHDWTVGTTQWSFNQLLSYRGERMKLEIIVDQQHNSEGHRSSDQNVENVQKIYLNEPYSLGSSVMGDERNNVVSRENDEIGRARYSSRSISSRKWFGSPYQYRLRLIPSQPTQNRLSKMGTNITLDQPVLRRWRSSLFPTLQRQGSHMNNDYPCSQSSDSAVPNTV